MTANPAPGGGTAPDAPSIDWASLINELGVLGQYAAQEFTDRASKSAQDARDGKYGADQWLQDVELFWDNLAKYAKAGIEVCRKKLPES